MEQLKKSYQLALKPPFPYTSQAEGRVAIIPVITKQQKRRRLLTIAPAIVAIAVALFLTVFRDRATDTAKNLIIEPAATLAVPESSPSAKEYIDRASKEADKNDYRKAIEILQEGLKRFPDDQNLRLTKEYYENQVQNYEQ